MKILKKALLIIAFAITLLVGSSLLYFNICCEKVVINGSSMNTTLVEGQLGVYVKRGSLIGKLERNDIIVFNYHKTDDSETKFVKRIIGKPNEHIEIKLNSKVYINGKEIEQNYLDESNYGKTFQLNNITRMDITLGDDEYYVMGDNRSVSYDSRFFGPIKKKDIVGKVVLTYGKYKSYNTETGEGKDKQIFPIRFY